MKTELKYPIYIRITFFLLMLVSFFAILIIAKQFLIPITVAAMLSFLLYPISNALEHKGLSRTVSIIISIIVAFIILGGLVYFVEARVKVFTSDIPLLKTQLNVKIFRIYDLIEERTTLTRMEQEGWIKNYEVSLETGGLFLNRVFKITGNVLLYIGLMPLYIFFFTYYKEKWVDFILKVTHHSKHSHFLKAITHISLVAQKYLTGLLTTIIILSAMNITGFLLLGLKQAILLGLLVGILNIIPYLGALVGGVLPVLMALLTKDSLWYAAGTAGIVLFVQFLNTHFITPKIIGSSVRINPLASLMALFAGALVWGVAGMMMFIPLVGMLKVVFDHFEELQPFGELLGKNKSEL